MANEITISGLLKCVKGSLNSQRSVSGTATMTGTKFVHNVQAIGFAAHEALAVGDVGTAGYALFLNTDGTNFVQLGTDATGSFVPFAKLKAGESAIIRLGTNAPYAKADTGAVNLEYWIIED